jgi:hypothetical protein
MVAIEVAVQSTGHQPPVARDDLRVLAQHRNWLRYSCPD